jgi:sterol 3beta-glucosyltransferase
MGDNIISDLGNNVRDLHGILCHVIPNCGNLSKHISSFLEKHPGGCKTASSCVQTIISSSSSIKVENNGVMFVYYDTVVFVGSRQSSMDSPQYETIHNLNDVTNIITTKKSLTIMFDSQMFIYKFKEVDNNVIDYVIQLYQLKPSWVRVKNNFHNPSRIKIVMLTIGSRGDVQPFIGLAQGFIEKNYNVKIVTHKCFEQFVKSNGIEFGGLSSDPKELMKLCVNNSMFSMNFINEGKKIFLDKLDNLLQEAYEECKGANWLLATPTSIAGYHIAEKLDIPFFNSFTMPLIDHGGQNILTLTSSDYYQSWYSSYRNYLVDFLADKAMWFAYGTKVNNWRTNTLQLPPKKFFESNQFIFNKQKIPTLYCYSEHIFPKPADWTDNIYVTGYWRSRADPDYEPPEDLANFLERHPKSLFVSFGSIPIKDPDTFYDIFIKYCKDKKIPLIIGKGWSTTSIKSTDDLIVIGEVPYEYLLKYVKLMVHHGGAGTTASCAHEAVPMLIIPFFGDQFLWGKCIQDLGVGCAVSNHDVNSYNISEILEFLLQDDNNEYVSNAIKLAEKLNQENGVKNAIEFIENFMLTSYVVPTGIPDSEFDSCSNTSCQQPFTMINRRHHCRNCMKCFCNRCTRHQIEIKKYRIKLERVCEMCFRELSDL